jgi:hypothetical protein
MAFFGGASSGSISRISKGKKSTYDQCHKRRLFLSLHTASFHHLFTVALGKIGFPAILSPPFSI